MTNDNDKFELRNDAPRKSPRKFTSNNGTQKVLFSGMNCLPGQRDLFQTDGEPEPERPKPNMIGNRAGLDCGKCWNPVDLCICTPKCEGCNPWQ